MVAHLLLLKASAMVLFPRLKAATALLQFGNIVLSATDHECPSSRLSALQTLSLLRLLKNATRCGDFSVEWPIALIRTTVGWTSPEPYGGMQANQAQQDVL